jgi:hypothetical protein
VRAAAAAAALALALAPGGCGGGCPASVDAEAWRSTPQHERDELAAEIDRCGQLAGRSKREVRALLGEPAGPHGWRRREAREWEYVAGYAESAYGPGDSRTLYVRFGADGRVTDTEVFPE